MWLDEPVKISKDIIHVVTGYPTTDKDKAIRNAPRAEIKKLIGDEWDGRGMKFNTIIDPKISFGAYVIGYNIFQSSRTNSVPCGAIDIAYKIVMKGLQLDLIELLLKKMEENMRTI